MWLNGEQNTSNMILLSYSMNFIEENNLWRK